MHNGGKGQPRLPAGSRRSQIAETDCIFNGLIAQIMACYSRKDDYLVTGHKVGSCDGGDGCTCSIHKYATGNAYAVQRQSRIFSCGILDGAAVEIQRAHGDTIAIAVVPLYRITKDQC
ncbi:hypothetical protein SDC9_205118 [bioreactor metagenome]|uniref:Uncharacterized protein n=1 Tax=bioreactor metagenome TaxID=1076179 RepID=A0A645JAD2_9ZZZZ